MATECFHCGLPVPKGTSYSVQINKEEQPMCCIGCQSVAQVIVDNGLTDFYNHRTTKSTKPSDLIPAELQIYDNEALQESFVSIPNDAQDGSIREASLILEGIVCAACVWLNERNVKQLEGVIDFRVNYSTHRASLKWDNSKIKLSDVLKAIADTGYNAHPFDPGRLDTLHQKEKSAALRRIALAGIGMMQVMMPAIAIYLGENSDMTDSMLHFLRWISLIITTPVVLYSSRVFFTSAWRDLKRGVFGMDVPVSLAIGSAYIASVWATLTNSGEVYFDSVVMFTFFLLLGRFLEMGARHKAGQVADALVRLLPQTATRLEKDAKGNDTQNVIAASELALGDRVLIKPGETIPADGSVIEGTSSANESVLTGESMPRPKTVGDALIGGSVNVESPLTMQIDKLGDSTLLSSIIRLLDRAQSEKPNLAKFADRSAGLFVLLLLGIAVAVFATWWFIDPSRAFWVALSVLVITCPCALSLATPAALTAATGNLTEQGVLATRGHALETLAKITHVIFDKTGTLTYGRLKVIKTQVLSDDLSKKQCNALASGLEASSEHPIAQAIQQLSSKPQNFVQLSSESGRGVEGKLNNKTYRIGTQSYVAELVGENNLKQAKSETTSLETAVYLGTKKQWLATFDLQDEIRKEAKQSIDKLKSMGIKVSLLSGDNPQAVKAVSQALGIENASAELLPADKLAQVQQYQSQGEVVAMIGDGVNDAPVLAAADVSIAMGSGSQLAQASADMILLSENLSQLPSSIQLSKRMQSIIRQNFGWAIVYNFIAIPLAAMGWVLPWMAAIGMSMSSLVVVLNALRLKK
ncbi:MAG: heavy metal translocating P-type ATPase [Cocleimonas sp.]|nr:heavy metal translocating P-type ATPase [Cocleimonas sp.]